MTDKIAQKIADIELELSRTQVNKKTMHHICLQKAKLASYKRELLERENATVGSAGEGWEVKRSGEARIGLFGFPSVGKSTLLNTLTGSNSEVASYEFTTLEPIPGILNINGAKIQILDLPGIIEGASEGAGRGKQVIAITRTCSVLLMVLDGVKDLKLLKTLEKELANFGIKLNKTPPKIYVQKRDRHGFSITSTVKQTHLSNEVIEDIMKNHYRIHHAVVKFDEVCTIDDLIDVLEGNRVYIKCIYVINKVDQLWPDMIEKFSKRPNTICVSARSGFHLKELVDKIWDELEMIRVYTQPKGKPRDPDPLVLSKNHAKVIDFCRKLHTSFVDRFSHAFVSGPSAKHKEQKCGKDHVLQDGDTVTLILNS